MAIYRISTQTTGSSSHVELPIVITTPKADLSILNSDRLFVLIGVHTLERAAARIQQRYRKFKRIPDLVMASKLQASVKKQKHELKPRCTVDRSAQMSMFEIAGTFC